MAWFNACNMHAGVVTYGLTDPAPSTRRFYACWHLREEYVCCLSGSWWVQLQGAGSLCRHCYQPIQHLNFIGEAEPVISPDRAKLVVLCPTCDHAQIVNYHATELRYQLLRWNAVIRCHTGTVWQYSLY
jgi:hypothetical protein